MKKVTFTVHYRHFLAKDIFHSWIDDQICDNIEEVSDTELCTTYITENESLVGIILGIPVWLKDKLDIETITGE